MLADRCGRLDFHQKIRQRERLDPPFCRTAWENPNCTLLYRLDGLILLARTMLSLCVASTLKGRTEHDAERSGPIDDIGLRKQAVLDRRVGDSRGVVKHIGEIHEHRPPLLLDSRPQGCRFIAGEYLQKGGRTRLQFS